LKKWNSHVVALLQRVQRIEFVIKKVIYNASCLSCKRRS